MGYIVLRQKWITRDDLKANRDVHYLFGDNLLEIGYGGQAKEMRGEPNAFGIPTKVSPSQFMSDNNLDGNITAIDKALGTALCQAIIIVVPLDGIGTGLADLANKAPKTWLHLDRMMRELIKGDL